MISETTAWAIEPTEIEALLPWYAAGTLRRRDRQRVEEALRSDPALARQADLVREELAETISLNESLGVPSARAMDRLMAAIDDETPRASAARAAVAGRFAKFIAGFSPRRSPLPHRRLVGDRIAGFCWSAC